MYVQRLKFYPLNPLADLGGGVPGARSPKGPDSLVLTYKIFEI